MSTSAYMIAHCDDDYLSEAIDSVIDYVDELIFVDGAYEWVAPFLPAVGIDPERSWSSTHDILQRYGKKIRYFSGLWRDELHKREFGFAQCRGDVIIRIDADEVFAIDDAAYREFRRSPKTVADMEFPYMVTERLQRLDAGHTDTPRQVCMFKRKAFRKPLDHCGYLWLVLTDEERQRIRPADWKQLFPRPVSRTAHLTALRTPRTAINRARFYTLQHIRITGQMPFTLNMPDGISGDERIRLVLDQIGPEGFATYLENHEIVSGFAQMNGFVLAPYELPAGAAATVAGALAKRRDVLGERLVVADRPLGVVNATLNPMPALVDVTSLMDPAIDRISLTFSDDIVAASGHLYFLLEDNGDDGRLRRGCIPQVSGRRVDYIFQPVTEPDIIQACMVLMIEVASDLTLTRLVAIETHKAG